MFAGCGTVYKLMYVVGFALMMAINLKTYKKYRFNQKMTIIITLITYVAGVVGAMLMGNIYTDLMVKNGFEVDSNVAIFGAVIFTPIFMTIASLILRQDWRRVLDMLAPGIFVILTCAKFGCFINGCCYGLECSFGIKYIWSNRIVFPIQIVEVFLMTLVVAFCFWFAFKSEKYSKGNVYPITTIMYCIIRFFVEFFRYYKYEEQRHIVFGMTMWQFCCILSIVVCILWLLALRMPFVKKSMRKLMQ